MTTQKLVRDLSDDDLRRVCDHMNIELKENATRSQMATALKSVGLSPTDKIDVPADPLTAARQRADETAKAAQHKVDPMLGKSPETYWNEFVDVIVDEQDAEGGDRPVYVNVNGRQIWVPRGKEVPLRRKYFEALQKAVRRVYDPSPDPTQVHRGGRDAYRFPARITADPSRLKDDEAAA